MAIAAMLIVSSINAQEKFIEVVVTDTVLVEPASWVYNVNIEKSDDMVKMISEKMFDAPKQKPVKKTVTTETPTTNDDPREAKIKEVTGRMGQIKKLAADNGGSDVNWQGEYSVKTTEPNLYEDHNISFRFFSKLALKNFVTALAGIKDIKGALVWVYGPEIAAYQPQLYNKLISSAKTKAAGIAAMAGKKAGDVISISEDTDKTKNFFESYLELVMGSMKSFGTGLFDSFMNMDLERVKIEKTIKVRFVLE